MTKPFRTDWEELSRFMKGQDLIEYAARSLCYARYGRDEYVRLSVGQQAGWHRRAAKTLREHGQKIDICKACGEIDPVIPQDLTKAAPMDFPYTDHRTIAQIDEEGFGG